MPHDFGGTFQILIYAICAQDITKMVNLTPFHSVLPSTAIYLSFTFDFKALKHINIEMVSSIKQLTPKQKNVLAAIRELRTKQNSNKLCSYRQL